MLFVILGSAIASLSSSWLSLSPAQQPTCTAAANPLIYPSVAYIYTYLPLFHSGLTDFYVVKLVIFGALDLKK